MTLMSRILQGSVTNLIRVACYLALIGLAAMCYAVISPRALPVIGAMSIGHAIGIAALACYLLAILIDEARRTRPPRREPASEVPEDAPESAPPAA